MNIRILTTLLFITLSVSSCGMKRALTLPKNDSPQKETVRNSQPLKPQKNISDNQEIKPASETDGQQQRTIAPIGQQINTVE